MNRTRRLALTAAAAALSLALGVGADGLLGGGDRLVPAHAQGKEVDLSAEWDKQWNRALDDSAKEYEKLYKFCKEKSLGFSAINMRRLVLRYDSENEDVRKFVGYQKTPDGKWIRDENRRDQIRDEADIEDPKAQKLPEKQLATNKKVAGFWKSLAVKAKKNGEAEPANAAAWTEKARRAWLRVLQVDSTHEEAHKALGHKKAFGRYCFPECERFLKVRDERKQLGQKHANLAFKTEPTGLTPVFAGGGQAGGAAKSEHLVVSSVHGKDIAARNATWGERTITDFVAMYAFPAEIAERMPWNTYGYVKDKEELRKVLQAGGYNAADLQMFLKHFSSTMLKGEFIAAASGGGDSDDHIIHNTGHALAHASRQMAILAEGDPNADMEDWLRESIAYDMTRRLIGTTQWICGAFGKYGNDIEPHPDKDIWIELAKRQVEYDDDVPLSRLWKLRLDEQQIRGPETVKGYAFLQFLFENGVEDGRKFVWTALAQGTPKAVEKVYAVSMDELDAKYRDWILKSW